MAGRARAGSEASAGLVCPGAGWGREGLQKGEGPREPLQSVDEWLDPLQVCRAPSVDTLARPLLPHVEGSGTHHCSVQELGGRVGTLLALPGMATEAKEVATPSSQKFWLETTAPVWGSTEVREQDTLVFVASWLLRFLWPC